MLLLFGLSCSTKILKIKWVDKNLNEEVLERKENLLKNFWKRSVLRQDTCLDTGYLLRDILESNVGKKRARERPKFEYFPQVLKDVENETFREMKELTYGDNQLHQTSFTTEYFIII